MSTLTTEDRARLRDLAGKATPGPWEHYTPNPRHALGVDAVFSVPLDCDPLARDSGIAEGMAPRDSRFIAAADPATVTALLDALDAAEAELATESQAASAAREVMDRHRCDEQAERAYRRADAAEAEVERLHSWAGLMELLDEHYPADLIPTAPDDPARDAGPRIVSLIRRVDAAEAARDTAERQVKAVRDVHEPIDAMHFAGRSQTIRKVCTGCGTDDGNWQVWPCPTIRALNAAAEAGR